MYEAVLDANCLDSVKEAHVDTALDEQLIERGEHDVPHPRVHLPHQRAAVGEERPQQPTQRRAGLGLGPLRVAAAVCEGEVVDDRADERALNRVALRAMPEQPVREVDAVYDIERPGSDHAVLDQTADDRDHQVDDVRRPAHAVVSCERGSS